MNIVMEGLGREIVPHVVPLLALPLEQRVTVPRLGHERSIGWVHFLQ